MNITLLGCGRWGSFIAWYMDAIKHNNVMVWYALIYFRKCDIINSPTNKNLTRQLR